MGKLLLLLVPDLNNAWNFFVICPSSYSVWLLTRHGEGMQKVSEQQERATSQIGSTQECNVDTDGPKQRAVWRDRHLSRKETDRGTAEAQEAHKASEIPCWIHPRVCSLTHFRLSHELNMTPGRFVSPRHWALSCVRVDSTSPNERCLNMDTSRGVLSCRFKRVTSIYLVTERVTGCFGWIVFVPW